MTISVCAGLGGRAVGSGATRDQMRSSPILAYTVGRLAMTLAPGRAAASVASRRDLTVEEIADERHHLIGLVLEREMTRVDQMKLEVAKITLVGVSAVGRKDLVVLAPNDKRRGLMLAEICLHLRIKRHIGSIVVEQVHLDIAIARAIEKHLIIDPIFGRDSSYVAHAIRVLEYRGLRRNELIERFAMLLRVVGPVRLDRVPKLLQSLVIGVAVLHDESADAFRVLERKTPTDGSTVVHDVHSESFDTQLTEQAVN